MSKKVNKLNNLYHCRYSGWSPNNDSSKVTGYSSFTEVSAGSFTLELDMYTYKQLEQDLKRHFGLSPDDGNSDSELPHKKLQQYRNHLSALTGFIIVQGKNNESIVGLEMSERFDASLADYLAKIDVSEKTRRDRKSQLKRIKSVYESTRENRLKGSAPKQIGSLRDALRSAFATLGIAPKTFAKKRGICPSALQRWLSGAEPNRRGLAELRRLEYALDMQKGTLTRLVSAETEPSSRSEPKGTESTAREAATVPKIAHRKHVVAQRVDPYSLPDSKISSRLKVEWQGLFSYKTAISPSLKRSARGSWGLIPIESAGKLPSSLVTAGTRCSMTGVFFMKSLQRYLGFLARACNLGGGGRTLDEVQTIAWLAHGDALQAYLDFQTDRSNGLMHRGQKTFASTVGGLLKKDTGYLWQSPQLRDSLPADVRPESDAAWRALCERAYEVMMAWVTKCNDTSRHPDEPIAHLLQLEKPMLPVLQAIETIRAEADVERSGSMRRALLIRDALMLSMLITNPLRERSLTALQYHDTNTGNLYRAGGGWRIRLPSAMLKNGRSGDGRRYDVAVAHWVGELIDEYVAEHRLVLLDGKESSRFWVGWRTKRFSSLSKRVFLLTKKYIAGSPGFSAQAFRHLVATNLLKVNPNAFVMVAELLNDRLETVIRCYAHLRRDDSFACHYRHIDELRGIISQTIR